MKAELISVGTELLLGQIVDTNAAYLAGELPALGIDCYFVSQVGDNLGRLVETLRRAVSRSDLVLMTGGLGPTQDDVTREAVAAMLGETMVVEPALEADLRARFARLSRRMPESNIKQATLIPSAKALPNPVGSAPGWWVEGTRAGLAPDGKSGWIIACMPGVPSEMRQMWQNEVKPRLAGRAGGGVIVSRTLKVLGLGESAAEDLIKGLLASENPTIGTYAKQDGVHLRLTAKAPDEKAARALIEPMEAEIRSILRRAIYGVEGDTPAQVVRDLLCRLGLTVGTAEYGTGGAVMALLEETGKDCYAGGLSLVGNGSLSALGLEGDERRWATPEGATALAKEIRQRCGASLGLGLAADLTAGPAGARSDKSAWVALDDGTSTVRTASMTYATTIIEMRRLAALAALNLLRLWLLDHGDSANTQIGGIGS